MNLVPWGVSLHTRKRDFAEMAPLPAGLPGHLKCLVPVCLVPCTVSASAVSVAHRRPSMMACPPANELGSLGRQLACQVAMRSDFATAGTPPCRSSWPFKMIDTCAGSMHSQRQWVSAANCCLSVLACLPAARVGSLRLDLARHAA